MTRPYGPPMSNSPQSRAARSQSALSQSAHARANGSTGDDQGAGTQVKIVVPDGQSMVSLLGSGDELLHVVERAFGSDILVRGNEITVSGPSEETAAVVAVFEELIELLRGGTPLTPETVERSIGMLRGREERPAEVLTLNILSARGKTIRPKTINQKRYVDAIDDHTVVFGIGPAGTGKTYLAMAKAVKSLQAKEVNRIILTRPAVEAGERLGYLPGTLYEKIDPYLRPLYDALHDMLDPDSIPRLMDAGTIEVAPLAYMRGRSQPAFTRVLTPDGWRRIGDLQIGDLVVGSDGHPTPVLGVYPQGKLDVYRVASQDDSFTLCSGDHLWTVRTAADKRRNKPWRVLKTRDMIGKLRAAHAHRYELPLVSAPVEFPASDVPMDPYALGLLLGDGCITGTITPTFTTADPELLAELEAALPGTRIRHRSRYDYFLNRVPAPAGSGNRVPNPANDALRSLELLGSRSCSKSIPAVYLYNSSSVRISLLQGLLDTDGGPVTQDARTCRVQYTTTSILLRDAVVELVQSLGGVAYSRRRLAEGRTQGSARGAYRQDAHVVDIRLPEGIEPFRLARKRENYHASGGGGRPMRFIDSIEPAGREECVCIQVAAADSLYVTEDYLLTHNTINDSFIILDEAQNTSPEQMKMFLTRLGFGSKVVVTGDVTQVDLPSGTQSGLRVVQGILEGVEDIHFSRLTSTDVVRHKLVSDIVDAYARYDAEQAQQGARGGGRRDGRRGR